MIKEVYIMNHLGIFIGIIGGIGLGLLLGSEFSGTFSTIIGGVLVCIFLGLLLVYSFFLRKKII